MSLLMHVPKPPLSAFVELMWLSKSQPQSHAKERLLPQGTMELVINLREDNIAVFDSGNINRLLHFPGAIFSGAHTSCFAIETTQEESVLGVHFRPGGAFPFLRASAGDLHNQHVALETLWGARASRLRAQLTEARSHTAQFAILESALLDSADRPLSHHPAVAWSLKEFDMGFEGISIANVTNRIGYSPKRFIHLFREAVGLSPNLFCRVQRFQQVIKCAHHARQISWAQVAQCCGYYDQAHFIKDFQAFSGLTPTQYMAIHKTDHLNHVPMPD